MHWDHHGYGFIYDRFLHDMDDIGDSYRTRPCATIINMPQSNKSSEENKVKKENHSTARIWLPPQYYQKREQVG